VINEDEVPTEVRPSEATNLQAMSPLAKEVVNLDDPNGVYVKLSRGDAIGAELVIGVLPLEWGSALHRMYVIFPPGETPGHLTILATFETDDLARSTAHTLALFKNLVYEEGWRMGQAASLDGRLAELNNTLTQAALVLSGCEVVANELQSIRATAHSRKKKGAKKG
jgi:hypothetical protein